MRLTLSQLLSPAIPLLASFITAVMYPDRHILRVNMIATILKTTEETLERIKRDIRNELFLVEHYIIKNNIWYYNYKALILFRKGKDNLLD